MFEELLCLSVQGFCGGEKKAASGVLESWVFTIFFFVACKPRIAVDSWSWFPGEQGRCVTSGTEGEPFPIYFCSRDGVCRH